MKRTEPDKSHTLFQLKFSEFQYTTERQFLLLRLSANFWNKQKTAKELGIQRSHLYNLVNFYRISENEVIDREFLETIFEPSPVTLPVFDYTNEVWKIYPKNKFYYVSDLGRVKTVTDVLLNQSCLSYAYPCVSLKSDSGTSTSTYVYRMVAETFIRNRNPAKFCHVNHKNRQKTDSRAINLEWVAPQQKSTQISEIVGAIPQCEFLKA